jgi:hypothetical protein
LEFISNNMLIVIVLPLGLGMIVMFAGSVMMAKKAAGEDASASDEDGEDAKQ